MESDLNALYDKRLTECKLYADAPLPTTTHHYPPRSRHSTNRTHTHTLAPPPPSCSLCVLTCAAAWHVHVHCRALENVSLVAARERATAEYLTQVQTHIARAKQHILAQAQVGLNPNPTSSPHLTSPHLTSSHLCSALSLFARSLRLAVAHFTLCFACMIYFFFFRSFFL